MDNKPVKNKGGRKSLYKGPETDQLVYKLCLLGAIDTEISDILGIRRSTLNNWRHMYPTFMDTIKKGKAIADSNVAANLYRRSNGYEYMEVTTETDVSGDAPVVKTRKTTKHLAADPTSMIFWLKNRRPDLWKDRREITGKDGGDLISLPAMDLTKLTPTERDVLRKIGEKSFNDQG